MLRGYKSDTIPKPQLVLGYKEFFQEQPPLNRLSIVKGICKKNLIVELAGLNYRLKKKNTKHQDVSVETQIKELRYFTFNQDSTFKRYSKIADAHTYSKSDFPLIFIKQSCLFALEEIIQSDLPIIENYNVSRPEVFESILQYLLAVNTTLTAIEKSENYEKVNFENLSPKMLPLNEQNVSIDPIYTPYRGYRLFEYLSTNSELSIEFKKYFETTFSLTFDHYIYETLSMYLGNKHPNPEHDFWYSVPQESKTLFKSLSQTYKSEDLIKLLSIRKYPFYKSESNTYILLDNVLLLEKSYSQFINDFWFDHVKKQKDENGQVRFTIKKYKSIIGYFFENYVKENIEYCFENSKHFKIKMFDELKITKKGGVIEIADLYIRFDSKVIVGQVKSTSIYDNEKYGGSMDALYKNDRNSFFELFGVNQLVKSLISLKSTIPNVDPGFIETKKYKIFPVLIVSEKALQTPLMSDIFQNRFLELLTEHKDIQTQINPLCIIHISDLENIQEFIHAKPSEIWNLLKYHCRYPDFMPPFYNSVDRKDIRSKYTRSVELYKKLILAFQVTENGS